VLDKTGTITEGRPQVRGVFVAGQTSGDTTAQKTSDAEDRLLRIAAALEHASEHPLAEAVVRRVQERGLDLPQAREFESLTGLGIVGNVEGERTLVGNAGLMEKHGIATGPLAAAAEHIAEKGETPLWVAAGDRLAGVIAVADTIKPSSTLAIRRMHAEGLRVVMLTGDNKLTANAIAREAGSAGDVTLMRSDLTGVAAAIALSRGTMRVMRQNLFWAFLYNVIGIPLAAGALYPVCGLLLSPVLASAAMALSSVSVVANSLRLRRLKTRIRAR
jgi:P-type Cu+ transporter